MRKQTGLVWYLIVFALIAGFCRPAPADDTKHSVRITLKDGKVLEYRKNQVAKIEVFKDGQAIESVSQKQAGERTLRFSIARTSFATFRAIGLGLLSGISDLLTVVDSQPGFRRRLKPRVGRVGRD